MTIEEAHRTVQLTDATGSEFTVALDLFLDRDRRRWWGRGEVPTEAPTLEPGDYTLRLGEHRGRILVRRLRTSWRAGSDSVASVEVLGSGAPPDGLFP